MARNPATHLGRRATLLNLALLAALLAACAPASPQASVTPSASSASPSAAAVTPSPVPSKGPATAQVSLTGSNGLTGALTANQIFCGGPSLAGPQIEVLGVAGTAGPNIVLFVSAGHIEARVATGAADTLKLRSFVGDGVTSFDAAKGFVLNATLTESTQAGSAVGDLGALSQISGTLDCGDELPGSSDVTVSGTAALGPLAGALTEFRVLCSVITSGTYVNVTGLSQAGTTPVLVFVTASTDLLQVVVETKDVADIYSSKTPGLVTLLPSGAQLSGDVTEQQVKAGETPLTLHVEGSAHCGITVHY